MMTIGKLKEMIKDKPDDTPVVRGNNCGGYEDITEVFEDIINSNFPDSKGNKLKDVKAVVID